MKVKFKKLRENAKLPTKAHEDDFCYDVYACDCEEVAPNVYKYPLGFALQIDKDENLHIDHNSMYPFSYGIIPHSENLILSIDFLSARGVQCGKLEWFSAILVEPLTGDIPVRFVHSSIM